MLKKLTFRPWALTFEESMTKAIVLESTAEAIRKHLGAGTGDELTVELFDISPDPRNKWKETLLVLLNDTSVGFINQPPQDIEVNMPKLLKDHE